MMGQLSSGQERLFYSFNIEDHIPANHLLRSIDRCFDLSDLRHYLADFYSPIGRPSIDPELMIRLLVVGYCYGIRSERRLCKRVLKLDRLRLRGMAGANDEFILAAAVQNLRRLAKPTSQGPPTTG